MYRGWDVHQYTSNIRARLRDEHASTATPYPVPAALMRDIAAVMGNKAALGNISRHTTPDGWLRDPELGPQHNFLWLLDRVWNKVKHNQSDLKEHFNETMDTIGTTCIQGITHRIYSDYVAICDDTEPLFSVAK